MSQPCESAMHWAHSPGVFFDPSRRPLRIDWRPPARLFVQNKALTYRVRPPLRPAPPKLDPLVRGEPTSSLNGTAQGELHVFLDRPDHHGRSPTDTGFTGVALAESQ